MSDRKHCQRRQNCDHDMGAHYRLFIRPGRHIGSCCCPIPQEQLIAIANDFWAAGRPALNAAKRPEEAL
jgi:hypothetical protein